MKMFSSQLIKRYVNGEEIENIESLEKNSDFMKEVINYTNDKKIYNLCDTALKKNYEFVMFLIQKFSEDKLFIYNVADHILNNGEISKIQKDEIIITMYNLTKDVIDGINLINLKYSILAASIYGETLSNIEIIKNSENKPDYFGLGFMFVLEFYQDSSVIQNFFAKQMINDLLFSNFNFDAYLHQKFHNPNDIKNINKTIIDYLNNFDSSLGWYVSCHIDILDNYKKNLTRILNFDVWKNYEKQLLKIRLDIIEEISEKMADFIYFTPDILVEYAVNILNLDKLFNKEKKPKKFLKIEKLDTKEKQIITKYLEYVKLIFNKYNINDLQKLDINDFMSANSIKIIKK